MKTPYLQHILYYYPYYPILFIVIKNKYKNILYIEREKGVKKSWDFWDRTNIYYIVTDNNKLKDWLKIKPKFTEVEYE